MSNDLSPAEWKRRRDLVEDAIVYKGLSMRETAIETGLSLDVVFRTMTRFKIESAFPNRKLGPTDIEEMVAMRNSGVTVREIAKEYGLDRRYASRVLVLNGAIHQARPVADQEAADARIAELNDQGLSDRQIAEEMGLTIHQVKPRRQALGLKKKITVTRNQLAQEKVDSIVAMRRRGESIAAVARHHEVSTTTVKKYCVLAGIS